MFVPGLSQTCAFTRVWKAVPLLTSYIYTDTHVLDHDWYWKRKMGEWNAGMSVITFHQEEIAETYIEATCTS